MDTRILVIGGGISGLTLAFYLRRAGVDVHVLEAEEEPGGCIKTRLDDGHMLEIGPNSMMVNRAGVLQYLDDLGLAGDTVEANKRAGKRFIVKGGSLHALPSSPWSFLRTPLFGVGDKLRLFREPFIGRGPKGESIAQFVRRRLGNGFYDYAINPFVSGVYAGDPDQLLAEAAVRKVWALEDQHGSLIMGGLKMMLGAKPEGRIKGRLVAFREGMMSMPQAAAGHLGDGITYQSPVRAIKRIEGGWEASTDSKTWRAQHLVLATPAGAAAQLLAPLSEEAATTLQRIPYAPVGVVHLNFNRADITHPLDGFGCLIPRKEGIQTLGTLFSSTLFEGRTGREQALLTCFIGGATNPGILERDDEAVITRVLDDLRPLVGLRGGPQFANLVRWPQAIPQYTHGHFERIAAIEAGMNRLGSISARANWRDGISVPDCILNAASLAGELAASAR